MNTLFYITSPADVNFAIILAQEYLKFNSSSKIYAFTHTSLMKDAILDKTNIFTDVISEYDTVYKSSSSLNELNITDEFRIKYFEENTKNNFWKFIYQDRWLSMRRRGFLYKEGTSYSRSRLLKTVLSKFDWIDEFIEKNMVEKVLYVTQDCGTSSASILFEISKYRNLAIFCPTISKFGNYIFLNNTIYSQVERLEDMYHKQPINIEENDVSERVKNIYNDIVTEKKAAYSVPIEKNKNLSFIFNKFKYVFNFYLSKRYKDPKLTSPFLFYYDKFYLFFNKLFLKKVFNFDPFNEEETYVYFPLHLEPELVLLLHSPFYSNQVSIIRNLAKSLPAHMTLVLKDHPAAFGRRNFSFYSSLKRIPNVKLIHPNTKSSKVIKNSLAVATLTGTTGVEAFYFKIPTITFGNVFYNFLPNIIQIKNMDLLPEIWKDIHLKVPKDSEILRYIQAIHDTGYEINFLKLVQDLSLLKPMEIADYRSKSMSNYAKYLYDL